MFQNHTITGLGYILFFASYGLYFLGLNEAIFGLKGEFEGSEVFFANFTYSFSQAIQKLQESGYLFPQILVIFFTYVIPISKLLLGILCLLQPIFLRHLNKCRYERYKRFYKKTMDFEDFQEQIKKLDGLVEKIAYFFTLKLEPAIIIRALSKFQFTDSFMAMIMLAMLMKTYVALEVLAGGFYFWGYCMLSLLATQIISLSQLPVNKNMLFEGVRYEYEMKQNDFVPNDIGVVKIQVEDVGKNQSREILRSQIIYSLVFMAIASVIFLFTYVFFFFTTSLSVEVNVLDYRITLFTSSLKGWELLDVLNDSVYFVNGYFTTILFVFIIPVFHLACIIFVYSYFAYSFLTDKDYKRYIDNQIFMKDTNLNLYNFIKSRSSATINGYDILILKYKNNKSWISTCINILDHLGDWSMMEVYCLAMISGYYTLNAVPNIEANMGYKDNTSNFYFMFPLLVTALLINFSFSGFAKHLHSLEHDDFYTYNEKYRYLQDLLRDMNGNNIDLSDEPRYSKKFSIKTRINLPSYYKMWFFMVFTVVVFIVSALYTANSYTPYPELSVEIGDEILGHQVPFFNQILSQLPYAIGNCDPATTNIKPQNKNFYRPSWSIVETTNFNREIEFDVPGVNEYDNSSCLPLVLSDEFIFVESLQYDPECIVESNPDSDCGIFPPGLFRFRVVVPPLDPMLFSIFKLTGLGTAWIQKADMFTNKEAKIQIDTIVRIPDLDVDFNAFWNDRSLCDISDPDHICSHVVGFNAGLINLIKNLLFGRELRFTYDYSYPFTLRLSFTFDCIEIENDEANDIEGNGQLRGPLTNLALKSFDLDSGTGNNNSLINQIVNSALPQINSYLNSPIEIPTIGNGTVANFLNQLIVINSQPPYTCPVVSNANDKNL